MGWRRGAGRGREFGIELHFVLVGEFAGLAGFRRRVAADKTSKQLTDIINRGGWAAARWQRRT